MRRAIETVGGTQGGHNMQLQLWPAIIKEGPRLGYEISIQHKPILHRLASTNEPLNYQLLNELNYLNCNYQILQKLIDGCINISSKLIKSQTRRQDQDTRAPFSDTRQILVSGDFPPPFLDTLLCRLVMSAPLWPYQSSQPSLNNETRYKVHNSLEVE